MADTSGMVAFPSGSIHAASTLTTLFSGGILRVTIHAPAIGERESHQIAREVTSAITSAGRRLKALVLDLSDTRAMTSLGLGMTVNLCKAAAQSGAATYAVGLNRELSDLFRMMRIDRLCTIAFDDEELKKLLPTRS